MADKQLTESAWKAFSKGKPPYKDAASLLKALNALDKAEKAGPADWLEALDDVDKQAEVLRKANKADKELGSYLDGVGKAAAKDRKAAETARDKAAAEEDEDEESPALLTKKMVPLLRQVLKGEVMRVLIATTGKETAVLMSRKAIPPARGKLLKEYLGVTGGVKLITGSCLLEEKAHTFVVTTQAAGLAKKIKGALLAQTELRFKVRVRGEDPNDLDDDGDDEVSVSDEEAAAAAAAQSAAAQAAAAATSTEPPAPNAPDAPPAPPPPAQAYAARLAQMQPRIDAGLQQPAIAAKVKGLLDFCATKAAADNHPAALQGLATLDKLLGSVAAAAATPPAAAGTETAGVDPGAAFNARLTALMPKVKQALTAGGDAALDVKLKTGEAGVAARKRDFDAAHALLDAVENLLAGKPAGAPAAEAGRPTAGSDPRSAEYDTLLAALQPRYDAAMAAPTSADTTEPRDAARRAWDLAAEAAAAANFERALLILKRLDDGGLLDRIAPAARPGATQSLVAQRNFLLTRWLLIPAELRAGLATLQAGLEASGEDADPEQLFDDVSDYLDDLLDGLQDRIDTAISGGTAASAFDGVVDAINSEPVLTLLDSNPIDSGVRFKQTVIDAVREVAAQFETA